nr:Fc receptor-like protein 2 isoform X4 [Manis javanica]
MLLWSLLIILAPVSEQSDWLTLLTPTSVFEGDSVVLTCQRKGDWKVKTMTYYKDGKVLQFLNKASSFPIPSAVLSDSGNYHCTATGRKYFQKTDISAIVNIEVQEILCPAPVSLLQRWPSPRVRREQLPRAPDPCHVEGRLRVLLVQGRNSDPERQKMEPSISNSCAEEAAGTSLGRKTQPSLQAELEIAAVRECDAGQYYCRADNGHGAIWSKMVTVPVRIPASRPVLTLRAPGAQAAVGDVLELRCEAQRGSSPILYRFYHENVTLGNSSAPFGGGASFNLSLMEEHSGNFSCEADNGLGPQRSAAVPLSVSGTGGYRRNLVTVSLLGGLFGVLGFVAVALFYHCSHKISGGSSVTDALRDASGPNPQESPHSSPLPATEELQPVYANVDPVEADVVYSQVWSIQLAEGSANTRRTFLEIQDSQVVYCDVKKTTLGAIRKKGQQQGRNSTKAAYQT